MSRKMRQGRFPPFGFEKSEFGFGEPFKTSFWTFFDFSEKNRFWVEGPERCARSGFPPSGSNFRSLGSGSYFWPCFWHFSISEKNRFGEDGPERCARSCFPPSGSNFRSSGSRGLLWPCFWRFSIFKKKKNVSGRTHLNPNTDYCFVVKKLSWSKKSRFQVWQLYTCFRNDNFLTTIQ